MYPIAVIAGGLATRLRPTTNHIPKSLIPINGKPFLYWQLKLLRSYGFNDVILCLGYKGDLVQKFIENSEFSDLNIKYSFDGNLQLGTGGAIKKALNILGPKFAVIYGDSYLPIDYNEILAWYESQECRSLMSVHLNENNLDSSNVLFQNNRIVGYSKSNKISEMKHIDYGFSILTQAAFENLSEKETFDLSEIFEKEIKLNQLAGYLVKERFYEVGSHKGIHDLEQFLGA